MNRLEEAGIIANKKVAQRRCDRKAVSKPFIGPHQLAVFVIVARIQDAPNGVQLQNERLRAVDTKNRQSLDMSGLFNFIGATEVDVRRDRSKDAYLA